MLTRVFEMRARLATVSKRLERRHLTSPSPCVDIEDVFILKRDGYLEASGGFLFDNEAQRLLGT